LFQLPENVPFLNGLLAKSLDEPEFATTIGLVKYGALRQRKPAVRLAWWVRLKELIKRLIVLVR
jgi:uncharacterized membrane protein (DUF4010 family)